MTDKQKSLSVMKREYIQTGDIWDIQQFAGYIPQVPMEQDEYVGTCDHFTAK